jgi:hypothetical protein
MAPCHDHVRDLRQTRETWRKHETREIFVPSLSREGAFPLVVVQPMHLSVLISVNLSGYGRLVQLSLRLSSHHPQTHHEAGQPERAKQSGHLRPHTFADARSYDDLKYQVRHKAHPLVFQPTLLNQKEVSLWASPTARHHLSGTPD